MKRLILIFVSIFSIVFASQAVPTIFTVNSNTDAGTGAGTIGDLRYCINQAAATPAGPHTIIFSIAMTITINSDLQINAGNHNSITINGFVDGVDGPDVIIRSGGALANQMIFNNTVAPMVYGLVFQNLDYGIHFNGVINGIVKGCYFGSNVAGTAIVTGINQAGVFIEKGGLSTAVATTAANIVGGSGTTLPNGLVTFSNNSERCIFVGCSQKTNAGAGVRVPALLVRDIGGTQIVNNYFGIDVTGTVKLGNGNQTTKMPLAHSNIYMNDALNSLIDRNVISGATGSGIHLENWCNNTKIKGNMIGTNAAGTAAYNGTTPSLSFSNEAAGIFIQGGTGMVIGYDGGVIAKERNIIAGNGGAKHNNWQATCDGGFSDYNQFGIYTESLGNSTIKGNYIGTDITGNSSGVGNVFGNRAGGIKMVTVSGVGSSNSQNNIIGGGTTINDRNIISSNGYLWKANDNTSTCGAPSPSGMVGGPGLLLQYANTSANTVSGNYIGLGADGLTALGNNANGIEIQGAASNNIGTPGVPNYICNNTWGIFLQVDFGSPYVPAANNTIVGNVIGLTPTNTVEGNGVRAGLTEGGGIGLQMGVTNNKIGTAVANGGNVISGNRLGISIETNSVTAGATASNGNTIYNNIIGLDPTGTIAKPNTSFGVLIDMGTQGTVFPFNNTIGGTAANQANTISSNQQSGIFISNAAAITPSVANNIVGNKIGTNTAGTGNFGNSQQGIEIVNVSNTTITSNLVANNSQNGISLTGTSTNTISTNTITANSANGIALTGSSSNSIQSNTISSNTSNGISLAASSASNIIGGVAAGEANTISTNGINGVVVDGAGSINNSIHKNSFSCNTNRGIVLSPAASGGNNNYAAPTINGTPTQITWTGPAGSTIEIFETDGCATCPSNPTRLQGKTFVVSGTSPFAFTTALGFDKTKTYTATSSAGSTTAAHNTSEFSQCYTLCQNPTSVTITGAPLTFCSGGSVTLTANVVGGSGTETYVWKLNGSVVGGNTTTFVASVAGSYTVEYSSTTTCSTTTSTAVTVTVNPRPTVTSSPTGIVCSGVAQNYTITSSVPSSFSWTRNAVAGISNATVTSSANPITETLTNITTAAINVVYTITATSTIGSCPAAAPFTYTVTVNPKPTITSSATAVVCSGVAQNYTITSNVPSSYSWTRNAVAGISNATVTSSSNPITEALINTTTAPINVVYNITPTATTGSCAGAPSKYTVTVNPTPTIISSATGVVCSGAAQNYTITSSVPSSFSWTRNVVAGISNATATSSSNPITEALINTTTAPIDVVYTIASTATTGSCASEPFTYTVTVNPKPTITSSATAVVCSGVAQNYTITSSVPSSYSWTRNAVAGISNATVTSSSNPITEALINTTSTPIDVVYMITTTGSCAGAVFTYTVTVNPTPAVSSSAIGSVCSEVAQNYTITSSVPSNFSWTRNAVAGISNATVTSSSNSITEALVNTTTAPIDVVYTIASTGACASAPFTYTVTVNPKPVASITPSGPTAFCSNQSVDLTASASGFTGGTFEWFNVSTSLGNSNPLTVNTAGSYTAVYTSSSSCASLLSASTSITINPDNSLADAGIDFSTCIGAVTLTGNVPVNGTGSWSVVLPSTAVVKPGATSNVANATFLVDGNIYKFVYTVSGACGANHTDQVEVTAGLTGLIVSAGGPSDTLCIKTNRALTASASGGSGHYSYVWVSSDGSFSSTSSNGNVTVQPVAGGETTYTVYAIDSLNTGCKTNDATVKIHAIESQDLNIPNLITPNGDHKNDVFYLADKVTGMPIIQQGSHVVIVNRWGSKVYEANNYDNNWVPNHLTDGVYYYHITSSCGNKEYKSWLQILGNTNN